MANATVNVGTYAGEAARPYVAAAILSADSIANNYVSVLENVHSKAVLRKFSGAAISAATCEFSTPNGQLTLGEAVLDATALQVNEQVCNKDLRATWESAQMRGQSSSAPADFTTYVAQYVAAKVAENVEINLWHGLYNSTTEMSHVGSATLRLELLNWTGMARVALSKLISYCQAGYATAEMGDSVGSGYPAAAACVLTRYIWTSSYNAPGRDNSSGRSRDTFSSGFHKY